MAQTPRPFSHELHLKLRLECNGCHSVAAASTRLEDNLLPREEACSPCHEQVRIPAQKPRPITRFNHQKHVALGNIAPVLRAAIESKRYLGRASEGAETLRLLDGATACTACHRGLERSSAIGRNALPAMADCLVCHSKIDVPWSCEFCHSNDTQEKTALLKPPSHTPDYLDAHNRKNANLDKESCAVCHGRTFTCLGCH